MEIRKANPGDAATLSKLNMDVQQIHADVLPHIYKQPESQTFALQFMQERLADPLNYFFIAHLDGEAIGYIYARIVDRPENPFRHAWKYIYIDQISIQPVHQKKGGGTELLQAVFSLAKEKGIETITLATWSFNQQACDFFSNHGFTSYNFRMWRSDFSLE